MSKCFSVLLNLGESTLSLCSGHLLTSPVTERVLPTPLTPSLGIVLLLE